MNKTSIALFVLYGFVIQITPWNPSAYSFAIETIEICISNFALWLVNEYYESLLSSKRTFLHYIMKIIVLSFGSTLLNLFPETTIKMLYQFPSIICMIRDGYGFGHMAFCNILILVILRAGFNAFPKHFFHFNEQKMVQIIWLVNFIYQIETFMFNFFQSYTMCDSNLINSLRITLNLNIDENRISTYNGISFFSKFLLIMAPSAQVLSMLIIKCQSPTTKKSIQRFKQRRLFKVIPEEQVTINLKHAEEGNEVTTKTSSQSQCEEEKIQETKKEKEWKGNRELILGITDLSFLQAQAGNSPEGIIIANINETVKEEEKIKVKVIYAQEENKLEHLDLDEIITISEPDNNQDSKGAKNQVEAKNGQKIAFDDIKDGTKIGLVGFNILLVLIIILCIGRIIQAYDVQGINKKFLDYMITWFSLKIGRMIESMLPLYWLLRKSESREFAVRKIKYYKTMILGRPHIPF